MVEMCPLPSIPGGWATREFRLAGTVLRVTLPACPDAFLDDPEVLAASRRDDYMPYWSHLWPASLESAAEVLRHTWPAGTRALEIGAGIALTGLAALSAGMHVVFSDYDRQAIALALYNARQNGFESRAEGLFLDWRTPLDRQFQVIFGCDVIYEKPNHAPILNLIEKMLAPQGEAWIIDPGRHQAGAFLELLRERPFDVVHRKLPCDSLELRPEMFSDLYILRHRTAGG